MKIGNYKLLFKFLLILLVGMSFMLIFVGSHSLYKAYQTKKWKPAKGVILKSGMNISKGGKAVYSPKIEYEYYVNGVKYRSNTIHSSKIMSYGRAHPQEILNQYPKGRTVTIFYDNENPKQSVILNGIKFDSAVPLGCGIVLLLFCFLFRMLSNKISNFIEIHERLKTQQNA